MSAHQQYALASFFGRDRGELTTYIPFASHLGVKTIETGPGFAVIMLPYRPELIGDPVRKVVFGGVITTLLDQATGLAVNCALDVLRAIATVDLRVDHLRAAAPGCDLYARAECYKLTRNIAFVRGVAYEDVPDDPFASCLGTYMLGASLASNPLEALLRDGAPETGEEKE